VAVTAAKLGRAPACAAAPKGSAKPIANKLQAYRVLIITLVEYVTNSRTPVYQIYGASDSN
jgi:hypothetical protein